MKQAANPLLVKNSSISIKIINTMGWGLPIGVCTICSFSFLYYQKKLIALFTTSTGQFCMSWNSSKFLSLHKAHATTSISSSCSSSRHFPISFTQSEREPASVEYEGLMGRVAKCQMPRGSPLKHEWQIQAPFHICHKAGQPPPFFSHFTRLA